MSNNVPKKHNWVFNDNYSFGQLVLTKEELIEDNIANMLQFTESMFDYDNLPPTIPHRRLELLNQIEGYSIWYKDKDNVYVFNGGLGGELDENYEPTIATIANPYLKLSKQLRIGKECVVMYNDVLHRGLMPIFKKNALLMADADITFDYALMNHRVPRIPVARNDNSMSSIKDFFKDVYDGVAFGAVLDKNFESDGVDSKDFADRTSNLKDLIEVTNYLNSRWVMQLGLNSNWNGKRESINESESGMNDTMLLPFIVQMKHERENAIEQINKMFGLNIKVKLSTAWQETYNKVSQQGGQENEETKETITND